MDGFAQIKSFYSWVFNNPDKIRPTHISLYLFLVNQNNRSMWVEWFKCPYDLAMQGACIGNKNTYYKCLDELVTFELIEYKKGINNYKAPLIKILQLYDNEPQTGNVSVPLSEPQTGKQTEPLSVLLNKNTYKLITDNYKLVNSNLEVWLNVKPKKIVLIPELSEFVEAALLKDPTLDELSVKLKYESWIENDWKNGNDKKIVNWKSALYNTVPYLKKKEKSSAQKEKDKPVVGRQTQETIENNFNTFYNSAEQLQR